MSRLSAQRKSAEIYILGLHTGIRTRVCSLYGVLSAERTVLLLFRLHGDQAADAKDMPTSQFHGSPLDLHARRTAVVVDLGHVAKDLRIDFGAHRFGEVFREGGIDDLVRNGCLDAEGSALVEFCEFCQYAAGLRLQMSVGYSLFRILDIAVWLISPKRKPCSISLLMCIKALKACRFSFFFILSTSPAAVILLQKS